ncbi:hypothetical protein PTTG_29862, partial [Puccinia triticina 1-1 BBBD Race 1]
MDVPDTLTNHRFRHQAAYAAKFFSRLVNYDWSRGRANTEADLSIDRLRSKKYLLTELHSTLLPLLRQHIIAISRALGDSNGWRLNPTLTLELVIEIQPKLELTLDRTICAIHDIIPGSRYKKTLTNDQHFKELKRYIIRGLDRSFGNELNYHLDRFFSECRWVMESRML